MPSTRLPAFQFYPADWLKDPNLRSVSIAARGLWIDMLCLMSESEPRGFLQDAKGNALSEIQIARMTGCPQQTVKKLLQELEDCGVFSRTNPGVVIYSRRMVRDEHKRNQNQENGKLGGNPKLRKSDNPPVNRDANRKPTPSSSSSLSSSSSVSPSVEENPKKDSCSEPPKPEPLEPPLMTFPTSGKTKSWDLTQSKLDEYVEAFPYLDVLSECRKARQWTVDNPQRQKTASGMPRFLSSWLGRAQDSGKCMGKPVTLHISPEDPRGNIKVMNSVINKLCLGSDDHGET